MSKKDYFDGKDYVTINGKSGTGSGGNYFSNKTQGGGYSTSGSFGIGGGSGGINTHEGSYYEGYDYAPGKHAYNMSFNSIIKQTSNPQSVYLMPEPYINLKGNNLSDDNVCKLVKHIKYQILNLEVFDLSNNKFGFYGVEWIFGYLYENNPCLPCAPKVIVTMNLSNNLIGDDGAKYMADSLAMGRFPNLKSLDVSGNHITPTGHLFFAQALESKNIKNLMITLTVNSLTIYDKINQAAKSTIEFVTKGLKYTIEQHNQSLKGTKWDGSSVRTDDVNKWKNCKDVASNVGMGYLSGFIKCAPLMEFPPAMFVCASKDGAMGLLDPDTFGCIVEINKFVEEINLMGD